MNSNDNAPVRDERSEAVQGAEAGAQAWRAVVHAQQSAAPDHADFYALAGHVVETLRALDGLAGVLVRQTAGYGAGREVYDDEGANPAHRLRSAVLALAEARQELATADRAANRFWSAVGHIGTRHQNGGPR
jgi:hypothetical protein